MHSAMFVIFFLATIFCLAESCCPYFKGADFQAKYKKFDNKSADCLMRHLYIKEGANNGNETKLTSIPFKGNSWCYKTVLGRAYCAHACTTEFGTIKSFECVTHACANQGLTAKDVSISCTCETTEGSNDTTNYVKKSTKQETWYDIEQFYVKECGPLA